MIAPYQPALERISPWMQELLAGQPKEHADLIDRFARWQLLRRLRLFGVRDHGTRVTRSGVQHARASILTTSRFLQWLDNENISLADLTQTGIERYLLRWPGRGPMLQPFLEWTARTGITAPVRAAAAPRPMPEVVMSDQSRWQQVAQLLHDDTIRLYVRIAGLFTLLWA